MGLFSKQKSEKELREELEQLRAQRQQLARQRAKGNARRALENAVMEERKYVKNERFKNSKVGRVVQRVAPVVDKFGARVREVAKRNFERAPEKNKALNDLFGMAPMPKSGKKKNEFMGW